MAWERSWHFLGGPGSWSYHLFDVQRRRLNRSLVDYLVSRAVSADESLVLEAGSGSGYGSSLFARHPKVKMSVALDVDLEALQEGRRRDPNLTLVLADLHALPFRSGVFDVVWNSSTLEHVARPSGALSEMQRVVKGGGFVFVGVPFRFGPLGFQRFVAQTRLGVWIGSVFDQSSLNRLVIEGGLTPIETITYFLACFIGVLSRKFTGASLRVRPATGISS